MSTATNTTKRSLQIDPMSTTTNTTKRSLQIDPKYIAQSPAKRVKPTVGSGISAARSSAPTSSAARSSVSAEPDDPRAWISKYASNEGVKRIGDQARYAQLEKLDTAGQKFERSWARDYAGEAHWSSKIMPTARDITASLAAKDPDFIDTDADPELQERIWAELGATGSGESVTVPLQVIMKRHYLGVHNVVNGIMSEIYTNPLAAGLRYGDQWNVDIVDPASAPMGPDQAYSTAKQLVDYIKSQNGYLNNIDHGTLDRQAMTAAPINELAIAAGLRKEGSKMGCLKSLDENYHNSGTCQSGSKINSYVQVGHEGQFTNDDKDEDMSQVHDCVEAWAWAKAETERQLFMSGMARKIQAKDRGEEYTFTAPNGTMFDINVTSCEFEGDLWSYTTGQGLKHADPKQYGRGQVLRPGNCDAFILAPTLTINKDGSKRFSWDANFYDMGVINPSFTPEEWEKEHAGEALYNPLSIRNTKEQLESLGDSVKIRDTPTTKCDEVYLNQALSRLPQLNPMSRERWLDPQTLYSSIESDLSSYYAQGGTNNGMLDMAKKISCPINLAVSGAAVGRRQRGWPAPRGSPLRSPARK